VYFIKATVTDNEANYQANQGNSVKATVVNVPPSLSGVTLTNPINENDFAALGGRIIDPGPNDIFSLSVNWRDGTALQTYNSSFDPKVLGASTPNFNVSHQFLLPGIYNIAVFATDKDGGVVSPPVVETLTVKDVAPTLGSITVNPAQVQENGK